MCRNFERCFVVRLVPCILIAYTWNCSFTQLVGLPLNNVFLMKFFTKQAVDYKLQVFFIEFLVSFLETQAFSLTY